MGLRRSILRGTSMFITIGLPRHILLRFKNGAQINGQMNLAKSDFSGLFAFTLKKPERQITIPLKRSTNIIPLYYSSSPSFKYSGLLETVSFLVQKSNLHIYFDANNVMDRRAISRIVFVCNGSADSAFWYVVENGSLAVHFLSQFDTHENGSLRCGFENGSSATPLWCILMFTKVCRLPRHTLLCFWKRIVGDSFCVYWYGHAWPIWKCF